MPSTLNDEIVKVELALTSSLVALLLVPAAGTVAAHCMRRLAAGPSCSHNCCTHSRSQVEKWPGVWLCPSQAAALHTNVFHIFTPLRGVVREGGGGSSTTSWPGRVSNYLLLACSNPCPDGPTFWPDNFLIPKPLPGTAACLAACLVAAVPSN